ICGGGPPPGTSCDSTALTMPPVSRPWMRMTIGMPSTFIFRPPSDETWIGFIIIGHDLPSFEAGWQDGKIIGGLSHGKGRGRLVPSIILFEECFRGRAIPVP